MLKMQENCPIFVIMLKNCPRFLTISDYATNVEKLPYFFDYAENAENSPIFVVMLKMQENFPIFVMLKMLKNCPRFMTICDYAKC